MYSQYKNVLVEHSLITWPNWAEQIIYPLILFTTQIFINNSSTFRRFYCVFILLDSTPLFILRLHKRFTIFRIYRIWDTLENNRGIFTDFETHPEFTDNETLPILILHRILHSFYFDIESFMVKYRRENGVILIS